MVPDRPGQLGDRAGDRARQGYRPDEQGPGAYGQDAVRASIKATQAAGEASPALDADRLDAAVIIAIQGGASLLLFTGSADLLGIILNLCLDHLLVQDLRSECSGRRVKANWIHA